MEYIFLHGFCSSPFSKKAVYFANKFKKYGIKIMVPDLNGDNFSEMTVSSQINIIRKIFERIDYRDVCLIGSSMGGLVAVHCANKFDNVKKLILFAPALDMKETRKNILGEDAFNKWKETGTTNVFHYKYNKEMEISYNFINDLENYKSYQIRLDIPILIYHGKDDNSVSYEQSEVFSKLNSNVHLEILDSDHQLHNQLNYMWKGIKDFLDFQKDVPIIDFIENTDVLSNIPRTGYLLKGITSPESVAEHSYNATILAMLIVDNMEDKVDKEKVLRMVLLHDIIESKLMDMPVRTKDILGTETIKVAENDAFRELIEELPNSESYYELWQEIQSIETLESRIVHAVDKLQMMIKVNIYQKQTNAELSDFWVRMKDFDFYGIDICRKLFSKLFEDKLYF